MEGWPESLDFGSCSYTGNAYQCRFEKGFSYSTQERKAINARIF